MEKITAIKIVLFIIGSLFVLIALYLFTRKKEANKAPGWIIAAIIVFTLQSSWDWFVTICSYKDPQSERYPQKENT